LPISTSISTSAERPERAEAPQRTGQDRPSHHPILGAPCFADERSSQASGVANGLVFPVLGHLASRLLGQVLDRSDSVGGDLELRTVASSDSFVATAALDPDGTIAVVVNNLTDRALFLRVWRRGRFIKYESPANATITLVLRPESARTSARSWLSTQLRSPLPGAGEADRTWRVRRRDGQRR